MTYKIIQGYNKFDFRINQFLDGTWEIGFPCDTGYGYRDCHEQSNNLAELLMLYHCEIIDDLSRFYDSSRKSGHAVDFDPQEGIGFLFYQIENNWVIEYKGKTYKGTDLFSLLVEVDEEPVKKKKRKS